MVTSITIGLFTVSALTGLVLFLDLSIGGVRATHEWLSIALIVAIVGHAYTHKKVFLKYFGHKQRFPMIIGLILGMSVFLFSYNDKYAAAEIFEITIDSKLKLVAEIFNTTPDIAKEALEQVGLSANVDQTLSDIALQNKTDIYDVIDVLLDINKSK